MPAPAPVPASVPDAPSGSPVGGGKNKLIIAAVAAVVVLGAAGGFYYMSGTPAAPVPPQEPVASAPATPVEAAPAADAPLAISDPLLDGAKAAEPAVKPAEAAPAPAAVPAPVPVPVPEPAPAPVPAPVVEKPAKPVKAVPPAAPANKTAGLEGVITDSLSEASHCMSQRKYDCAIANANAVLRMDTGNRYALDIKRKAKEAQDKALSQIQIE